MNVQPRQIAKGGSPPEATGSIFGGADSGRGTPGIVRRSERRIKGGDNTT